jgi:hypothetical protein
MPDAVEPTPASSAESALDAAAANAANSPLERMFARLPRIPQGRADLPNTLVAAYWAIICSSVLAIALGVAFKTQSSWFHDESAKQVAKDSTLTMPSEGEIGNYLTSMLVGLCILALLMCLVGWGVLRGLPGSRWGIAAIWALCTIGLISLVPGMSFLGLPTAIALIVGGAPAILSIPSLLSALFLLAAFLLVLVRPSKLYFAQEKRSRIAALEEAAAGRGGDAPPSQGFLGRLLRPAPRPARLPREPRAARPARVGRSAATAAEPKSRAVSVDAAADASPSSVAPVSRSSSAAKRKAARAAAGDATVDLAKGGGDRGGPERARKAKSRAARG